VRVGKATSLLFTLDHTRDDNYLDTRFLAGLTFRF
jgi:hypothetical protein